jgi:hypothetical protein
MGVPAPVESGDIGDASIVVSMGNDTADTPLDELQGCAAPSADETAEESSTEESTTEDTTADTTADATTETTTG